jgi:hypothetical protein
MGSTNDCLYELMERLGERQRGEINHTGRMTGVTEVTRILGGRLFPHTLRSKEDTICAPLETVFPGESLLI